LFRKRALRGSTSNVKKNVLPDALNEPSVELASSFYSKPTASNAADISDPRTSIQIKKKTNVQAMLSSGFVTTRNVNSQAAGSHKGMVLSK
jgi:hypothetical protein